MVDINVFYLLEGVKLLNMRIISELSNIRIECQSDADKHQTDEIIKEYQELNYDLRDFELSLDKNQIDKFEKIFLKRG